MICTVAELTQSSKKKENSTEDHKEDTKGPIVGNDQGKKKAK